MSRLSTAFLIHIAKPLITYNLLILYIYNQEGIKEHGRTPLL